jgi:N-carbamoylputrescine amidase
VARRPDSPKSGIWSSLAADVARSGPEVLVTNEMPFGPWLASVPNFDSEQALESVQIHEAGLEALRALDVPVIISSCPAVAGGRLVNEAFVLEHGCFRFLHQKHFFPAEEGWFETDWFRTAKPGFEVMDVGGLRIGALICTELMFNERARAYGRAGDILSPFRVLPGGHQRRGRRLERWPQSFRGATL